MRLVVGHEQQLVRRGETVLPTMQLSGGDLASSREQLDLGDMRLVALPCLTAPDPALALQVAGMRRRRAAPAEPVLGHEQVVAHCTHQWTQHVLERIEQRVLPVASLLAVEDGEDMMRRRAGDTITQQALQKRN